MAALLTPLTGSIIQGPNGVDGTFTGLSTNILIKVGPYPVGAIQKIDITEERDIQMVDELGTDGHIDSAPIKSTNYSGTCTRVRFDRVRVTEAFGRGYLHVKSQRIPFDIDIYDNWAGDGSNAIITTITNVWIKSLSYSYAADNWIIIDNMAWVAEDMSSTLNGSNAATGGLLGANILQINAIEQETDVGAFRGALSAPGLINDFFSNV